MAAQQKIVIFANGCARRVDGGATLGMLAREFKLDYRGILVECNGVALLPHEWPGRRLQHGDRVEFLRVTAGG
jgi:thiamine biosynthesis protein ThiS